MEVFYCIHQVCDKLFPNIPKSTIKCRMKNLGHVKNNTTANYLMCFIRVAKFRHANKSRDCLIGVGGWVVGHGSWVVGCGSWVVGRGSWVVGRGYTSCIHTFMLFQMPSHNSGFVCDLFLVYTLSDS